MKLDAMASVTETNCNLANQAFSIKASPIAFDILSSKLYSNPVLAIVRELLTNAYDAQKANGNEETQIEVHLPTYEDSYFSIRDFGTGLSKEDVLSLYTTFFDSSKNTSNDFTGCFGLGSKVPFSYTSTFSVTSFFNGTKYDFLAIKKDGYPHIYVTGESPTDEPNGLKIHIPLNDQSSTEQARFQSLLESYLRFVPEIKINCNKALKRYNPIFSHQMLHVYKSNTRYYDKYLWIKQGQNTYDVRNILPDFNNSFLGQCTGDLDIVIEVPIGTLGITPSREQLTMDDTGKKKVYDLITQANVTLTQFIIEDTDMKYACYDCFRSAYTQQFYRNHLQGCDITLFTANYSEVKLDEYKTSFSRHLSVATYRGWTSVPSYDANTTYTVVLGVPMGKSTYQRVKSYLKWSYEEKSNFLFMESCGYYLRYNQQYGTRKETLCTYKKMMKDLLKFIKHMEAVTRMNIKFKIITYKQFCKEYRPSKDISDSSISISSTAKSIKKCAWDFGEIPIEPHYPELYLSVSNRDDYSETVATLRNNFPKDRTLVIVSDESDWVVERKLSCIASMCSIKDTTGKFFIREKFAVEYGMDYRTLRFLKVFPSNKRHFKDYQKILLDEFIHDINEHDWSISTQRAMDVIPMNHARHILSMSFKWKELDVILKSTLWKQYSRLYDYLDRKNCYVFPENKDIYKTLYSDVIDTAKHVKVLDYVKNLISPSLARFISILNRSTVRMYHDKKAQKHITIHSLGNGSQHSLLRVVHGGNW